MVDIVVFDTETDGYSPASLMTVAATMELNYNASKRQWEEGTARVFWKESMEDLVALLDNARCLVAYNAPFDVHVIERTAHVDRELAWLTKTVDPCHEFADAIGVTPSLKEVLALNGLDPKTHASSEAPILWRTGQLEELASYCLQDVRQTAALFMNPWPLLLPYHKQRLCVDHEFVEGGAMKAPFVIGDVRPFSFRKAIQRRVYRLTGKWSAEVIADLEIHGDSPAELNEHVREEFLRQLSVKESLFHQDMEIYCNLCGDCEGSN